MSAWINCAERLPELIPDEFDRESRWVLVRTAAPQSEVYVAHLRQLWEYDDTPRAPEWIARGPDGYELENVVEWTEIPA